MSTAAIEVDFDSTLIRRGSQAATFTDMADFVTAIEQRPIDKLLGDLPGFARLSETKLRLAQLVLDRRLRELDDISREQFRVFAEEIARSANATVAARIRGLFRSFSS